jgi:hypothetical protein
MGVVFTLSVKTTPIYIPIKNDRCRVGILGEYPRISGDSPHLFLRWCMLASASLSVAINGNPYSAAVDIPTESWSGSAVK